MTNTKIFINRWFNLHLDMMEELHDETLVTGTDEGTYASDEELIDAIKSAMEHLTDELNAIKVQAEIISLNRPGGKTEKISTD